MSQNQYFFCLKMLLAFVVLERNLKISSKHLQKSSTCKGESEVCITCLAFLHDFLHTPKCTYGNALFPCPQTHTQAQFERCGFKIDNTWILLEIVLDKLWDRSNHAIAVIPFNNLLVGNSSKEKRNTHLYSWVVKSMAQTSWQIDKILYVFLNHLLLINHCNVIYMKVAISHCNFLFL